RPRQDPRLRSTGSRARGQEQELNAKLREFKTRQIDVILREDRDQVAKLVEESKIAERRCADPFAFDSPEILPEARPALDELGKALSDPKLASETFLNAGHTDARGIISACRSCAPRR